MTGTQEGRVTGAKLRQAVELMRNLMKKYPNGSDEELHRRFREELVRDPAMQDAIRRDIFIDLLRELQAGKTPRL
jgi:hypothetical protein